MKNSKPAYRRHDLSDETWALLEPHLPGRKGVWEQLLEILIDEPNYEWSRDYTIYKLSAIRRCPVLITSIRAILVQT